MPGAFAAQEPARCARHDVLARVRCRRALVAKPGRARLRGELEVGIVRNLCAHVTEGYAVGSARNPADDLFAQLELVPRRRFALDVEDSQPAVDLAPVVLAGDRLLPRVTPFAEADVRLLEAGLGREDGVVELA